MKNIKKIINNKLTSDVGLTNDTVRVTWITKKLNNLPKGSRLLDAGAGELRFKPYCQHLNYVAQDFGQYDGSGDSKGLQTKSWDNTKLDIISDIIHIPEKDGSFDAILCIEVFEHLPDPVLAIKEFSRLLKKGGKLILTAPFCSLTHFSPYHFSTGFNRYYYQKHLGDYGLKIVEITPNGNYFEYLAQELRRLDYVAKEYCGKGVGLIYQILIHFLLNLLARLSKRDQGSFSLLNYGYQILAEKE